MKLKGELDSIGLAELFRTLGDQRATGVLTLTNPNGQKIIALADGEIAVISDKIAERSRLGDLLIARGRLTDQQLNEALRIQRTNEPRTRLGDLLIKHNMIRPQDIADSLKFQMEEEIYDLFTWRNADFDFDGERSVDEVVADSAFDNNIQRVSLNPQQLIGEATRRMEEWKAIEARLPSPYLCFKLTPKGEELSSKGTQATQQILKLLKEGRTIETTVKKSCLGRFNVCKALVKLLDDGWIFPYPSAELRMLAAEHRSHNRFSDALHIYRRILEGLPTDAEQDELQELIDETVDSIRRAQEAGESVEGLETVSYKEAADRFKRRQKGKRLAAMLVLGLSAIAGAYYFSMRLIPPPTIAEDYRKALDAAQLAENQKKFSTAIRIWKEFLAKLPDQNSATGKLVQEQVDSLPLRHEEYLITLIIPHEQEEQNGNLEAAEVGIRRLIDLYKESKQLDRMNALLKRILDKKAELDLLKQFEDLKVKLADARSKLGQKQYQSVRPVFTEITGKLEKIQALLSRDESKTKESQEAQTLLKESQAALKTMADIEGKSAALLKQGQKEIADNTAELSRKTFADAAAEWPELESSKTALKELEAVNAEFTKLTNDIARATTSATTGGKSIALDQFRSIAQNYKKFARTLKEQNIEGKIKELEGNLASVDQAIQQATAKYAVDKDGGIESFKEVLRQYSPVLAQRETKVPVRIITFPPGVTVKLDGSALGTTPLYTEMACGRAHQFEFSKDGYENLQTQVERVTPDDLDMKIGMKRAPVADIPLKPGLRSAPRIISDKMFALHGTSLTVLEPLGQNVHFTKDKLFDDSAQNKPNASGTGAVEFVGEKSWWWPHAPVEPIDNNRLLLSLRTREVMMIDVDKKTVTPLAKVPGEPVGRVYVEAVSILNQSTIFAVGTADGKVRSYELNKPQNPLWEKAVDPNNPAPKGGLATGLARRGNGHFAALTMNGKLAMYNVVTGEELKSLELKAALAPGNSLPEKPEDTTAAIVHLDGKISAIDMMNFTLLWDLSFGRGLDEAAYAVCGMNAVFIINKDGQIKRYAREKLNGKPNLQWNRPTGGPAVIPLHLGKYLYAAVNTGTIYAIDPADGRVMWDIRSDLHPVELYEFGGYLYIATQEGRLIVMRID